MRTVSSRGRDSIVISAIFVSVVRIRHGFVELAFWQLESKVDLRDAERCHARTKAMYKLRSRSDMS
jgi:hypothetical protein